jgi:hypothetical protein
MIVHAEHGVAGKALEQLVLEHRLRAAKAFLGRLKDEVHGAVEIARLGKVTRGAEQHRGVAVMAAGVHHARLRRLVGYVVRLEDRQRIHVGAQADRDRAVAFAQHADNAGPADAAMHLDAERFELPGHDVGGAMLGKPDLGIGVEVAARGSEFRMVGFDAIDRVHGLVSG